MTIPVSNVIPRDLPVLAPDSIMAPKEHGTSHVPVQSNLKWNVDVKLADEICNFNRHGAEHFGYFETTTFIKEMEAFLFNKDPADIPSVTFYDSNTGKSLFRILQQPGGRTWQKWLEESKDHGWPSFRDDEVDWDNVRCLTNSRECVSVDGTHLGHNLPDSSGNRYCINLVCIAGHPTTTPS